MFLYSDVVNVCALCEFMCKVRPRTFECLAMGSPVLFILESILLLYSARSGVNRLFFFWIKYKIVMFCPGKNVCRYVCMYFLVHSCVYSRCDGDVICVRHDRCYGWW